MEPVSFGGGIARLAGAMDCVMDTKAKFDSYKHAKFESQPLVAQRSADRILLQQWRDSVGYGCDQSKDPHHPALDDPEVRRVVEEIIQCINDIDGDAEHTSVNAALPSTGSKIRPEGPKSQEKGAVRLGKYQGPISRKAKWNWTLQDKSKLSEQTQNFAALLQRLHDLVPPAQTDGTNSTQPSTGMQELQSFHDLVQQLSITIEKALYQDMQRRTDDFKKELPRWLGAAPTTAMFDNFVQRRLEGTCDWIFQRSEFKQWENSTLDCTKVLWVHGPAGYGKTILCAKIIQYLQLTDAHVAYHFFSSDLETNADPFAIIRAWTYQIVSKNEHAFELAMVRWESGDKRPATPKEIDELFKAIVQELPNIIFVVDGLDECAGLGHDWKAGYRQPLVNFFDFLHQFISGSIKLAIVSRDEPEIREGIQMDKHSARWAVFDCLIQPDDVKDDATRFARDIVDNKLQNKSQAQREELSTRIVDRFESMFLGIRALEGQLRSTRSIGLLQRTIDQAPTKLADLYDRNWIRISKLDEPERSRTLAILRWVTFALRPMTILEITEALLLADDECEALAEDELPEVIDEEYIRQEIIDLCGPLVETRGGDSEPASRTIHLTHFSVRQYILCHELVPMGQLVSNERLQAREEATQSNILAITCLRYLNIDQVWEERRIEGKMPAFQAFRDYAVKSWHKHIKEGAMNTSQAMDLMETFFHPENKRWEKWREQFDIFSEDPMLEFEGKIEGGNRLFYAALLGFMKTVARLAQDFGLDVNLVDNSGRTALLAASSVGWIDGVRYLIETGAGVDITSNQGRSPLYVASNNGHTEIVQLLLKKGSDWTIADRYRQTPLHMASHRGHLEVTKILLEEGANINAIDIDGWIPLHTAASNGHLELVKLLLEEGADLNANYMDGWTPLFVAASNGHLELVKLLLEEGADLNANDMDGWTPLFLAASNGHLELVKLLLEEGADLNANYTDGWTPLFVAANNGHLELVKLLLEEGADLNANDIDGWTPLFVAASNGHLELVKLLLEEGADLNANYMDGVTLLHTASHYGRLEIAKLLLEKGANPTIAENNGWTPLKLASNEGHLEVVRLLLDQEANAMIANNNGWTPLNSASSKGHLEVVRLLLDQGADTIIANNDGWTPLNSASSEGHLEVVRLLLDQGADPTIASNDGWTPLNSASDEGHLEVVRLLLDQGADTIIANNNGWTPLNSASDEGHLEVVRLLLEKGADITVVDKDGWTPLQSASYKGHLDIAEALLSRGAGLVAVNRFGETALISAASQNKWQVAELLLKHGAGFTKDVRGKTALIWAARRGHCESIKVLLSHKADPNIRDCVGRTAISYAAGNGHDNVVQMLLAVEGIRTDLEDCNGRTPIRWAARTSKSDAFWLLYHHGALETEPLKDDLVFQLAMFMSDDEIRGLPGWDTMRFEGLFGLENLFQGQ